MSLCESCGGVIGRDCFNPEECRWIAEQQMQEPEPTAEEYCAGTGHPLYATHPEGWASCYCGQRIYPAQMDDALRRHFVRCLRSDLETAPFTGRVTPWDAVTRNWRDGEDRSVPKRLRVIPDSKWAPR